MMLYTIFDASVIFKDGCIGKQQANANYCEMNVDGIVV